MSEGKKKSKKAEAPAIPARPAGHADDSGCYGCQYHDPSPTNTGTCNYCYITGHTRGSTVEECTKKVEGDRLFMARDMMLDGSNAPLPQRKIEEQAAKRRIEQPWEQPKGKWSGFSRKIAWELYQSGKQDTEIAEHVGVTRQTIRAWRDKHGLPAHPNKGRPRKNGTE